MTSDPNKDINIGPIAITALGLVAFLTLRKVLSTPEPAPEPPTPPGPEPLPTGVMAKSGSAADIQAAIVAAQSGDKVARIPAGTFTLGGSVSVPDGIRLIGQGMDHTILIASGSQQINVSGTACRVSGFTIKNPSNNGPDAINITNAAGFRVDHMGIEGFGPGYKAAVSVRGSLGGLSSRGVIDHNRVKAPLNTTSYGCAVFGNGDWLYEDVDHRDDFFGDNFKTYQANGVYIEDNVFYNTRHAVATNNASYIVFRHNEIFGGNSNTSSRIDSHGPNQWMNGGRFWEIYNNIIHTPAPYGNSFAINPRGGDGVVFNNVVEGYKEAVELTLDEGQVNVYPQIHQIHRAYVWGNTGAPVEVRVGDWVTSYNAIQEGRDWFHFMRSGYTPYVYPHPLVK